MIAIENWGLIDYQNAWDKQKEYVRRVQREEQASTMVFCEHPTVITIGRGGLKENLNTSVSDLERLGISVIENNRGGDVTLHNPGQLIGYPIFKLTQWKEDLHWFLRELELSIIESLESFDIKSQQIAGLTGVWVEHSHKICAIGINCSRWVTSHGFALNVENDLKEFEHIVPCGIHDKSVTSMSQIKGSKINLQEVAGICGEVIKTRFS